MYQEEEFAEFSINPDLMYSSSFYPPNQSKEAFCATIFQQIADSGKGGFIDIIIYTEEHAL